MLACFMQLFSSYETNRIGFPLTGEQRTKMDRSDLGETQILSAMQKSCSSISIGGDSRHKLVVNRSIIWTDAQKVFSHARCIERVQTKIHAKSLLWRNPHTWVVRTLLILMLWAPIRRYKLRSAQPLACSKAQGAVRGLSHLHLTYPRRQEPGLCRGFGPAFRLSWA